jgi:hypothetical protein
MERNRMWGGGREKDGKEREGYELLVKRKISEEKRTRIREGKGK